MDKETKENIGCLGTFIFVIVVIVVSIILVGSLKQEASEISTMNGRIIMEGGNFAVVTAEVNLRNDKGHMICKLDRGTIVEINGNHDKKENRSWVTVITGDYKEEYGNILKGGLLRLIPLESYDRVKVKKDIEAYDKKGKFIFTLPEGTKVKVLGFSKEDPNYAVILFVDESDDSANKVACVHKSAV